MMIVFGDMELKVVGVFVFCFMYQELVNLDGGVCVFVVLGKIWVLDVLLVS